MSYDDIFRDIGVESMADLLPIYYSIERMISNLDKIIECINETENLAYECVGERAIFCAIETMSSLSECYNKNMGEFSSAFMSLSQMGAFSLSRWIGGTKRYRWWQEDLKHLIYPLVGVADGIMRFLIANARVIYRARENIEHVSEADLKTIEIFKPSIDTLLASKGRRVTKNINYFLSENFVTLLEEAKAHLVEARERLSMIAIEVRRGIDKFIARRMRRKKP